MSTASFWQPPPLDRYDEELIRAYIDVGRPLDDLPYTESFDRLMDKLGAEDSDRERHNVYKRLLTLEKQGRLPLVMPGAF